MLTDRFEAALVYAARIHGTQTRKGTRIPYLGHLLGVASIVIEDGGDEDEAVAALLHDAVEDQGGLARLEDIRARFGDRVKAIVAGCSDTDTPDKPPWRQRKDVYLAHLRNAPAEVLRVSAADKLYNARAILADYREFGETIWSRFAVGRDDIFWYYRVLVDLFGERGPDRLAEELARTVAELHHLAAASPGEGARDQSSSGDPP